MLLSKIMLKHKINKKISGQNIKIGINYSTYCKKKISEILNKYAVKAISYSSNIIKKKYYYKVKLKQSDYDKIKSFSSLKKYIRK